LTKHLYKIELWEEPVYYDFRDQYFHEHRLVNQAVVLKQTGQDDIEGLQVKWRVKRCGVDCDVDARVGLENGIGERVDQA
jgi:hypothetical protein